MLMTTEQPMKTCPSKEELRSLSLGQLADSDSETLLSHLDTCIVCQSNLETVDDAEDSLIVSLRGTESDEVDAEPQRELAMARALSALVHAHAEKEEEFPQTIGEYELLQTLGHGGMGKVYLARHTKLGREVALKVIVDHRLPDTRVRKRFENEMQAVGRLSHPNIVTAYDAREIDATAVLVTEYIDGLDLGQIVQRVGPLSIADACQVSKQVAVALQYTSEQGFVHRDIKPSNVMVSRSGEVKILDLGLARIHSGEEHRSEMTGTGQTMGTADYVSPEQITDSREVDVRSDIYSLGCTLTKLLTGNAPFDSSKHSTAYAKMNAHVSETPPKLSGARDDIPKPLVKLIERMLAKQPQQRPQNPMDVAQALGQYTAGSNLTQLVELSLQTDPVVVDAAIFPLEPTTEQRTNEPLAWWLKKVPLFTAIAAGALGLLIGAACGILIKIKSPDGTITSIEVPEGSEILIESDNSKVAANGGQTEGAQTTPDTGSSAQSGDAAALQSLGDIVPIMFVKVFSDTPLKPKGKLFRKEITTSQAETATVLQDDQGLWFQVNEEFDSAATIGIGEDRYLLVSSDPQDRMDWKDLKNQIVTSQYSHGRVELDFAEPAATKLSQLTERNNGKKLAIIVDGRVVMSASILATLSDQMTISGRLTEGQIETLMSATRTAQPSDTSSQERELPSVLGSMMREFGLGNRARTRTEEYERMANREKLRTIAIALHNYHRVYNELPASAGTKIGGHAPAGEKTQPFSWRVALLPFVEGAELYEEYRFDEPWDSEHNSKLIPKIPELFKSKNPHTPVGQTHVQGLAGEDRIFGIEEGTHFRDILDGSSNTAMLVETESSIPWTQPVDVTGMPDFAGDVFMIMGDGSSFERPKVENAFLKALMSRNGNDVVEVGRAIRGQ